MKIVVFLLFSVFVCKAQNITIGHLEKHHKELDEVISKDAKAEIISEGHQWTEGPLWVGNYLLFSDVPKNTVYKWTEEKGTTIYLKPSGFTGANSKSKEPGSNGLLLNINGDLILCQHGDRRIASIQMNSNLKEFTSLASHYKGLRFSSPNDADITTEGEIYFTDPPYGLTSQNDTDPSKEIGFNGVYKIKTNGEVILLVDSLTRPNGIALFPDEKKLLIANSDPNKPNWYIYDIAGDKLTNGKIFFSMKEQLPGLPDGLKIGKNGIIYTSGPGGILFFNKDGELLGRYKLEEPVSNCALSDDQKTLYITNNKRVLRLKMRE